MSVCVCVRALVSTHKTCLLKFWLLISKEGEDYGRGREEREPTRQPTD